MPSRTVISLRRLWFKEVIKVRTFCSNEWSSIPLLLNLTSQSLFITQRKISFSLNATKTVDDGIDVGEKLADLSKK